MSTTPQQIAAHQAAVALAEGARQAAQAAAKASYSGLAAGWPAYDAAIKAADVAYMRALMASYQLNGLGTGPSRTLHELVGQDT
ncbi:hypothetical protein [Bradyrhizobium sp.]|jgi:hypothetical protein|uniref:hypothetical protein n=1 Tax=Bradyrhizobium sp. TaxID=376 RepID=UPI003BAE9948